MTDIAISALYSIKYIIQFIMGNYLHPSYTIVAGYNKSKNSQFLISVENC